MAQRILDNVLASNALLSNMTAPHVFKNVAATQMTILLSMLEGIPVTTIEAAQLASAVGSSVFPDEDKARLQMKIAERAAASASDGQSKGQKGQRYETIVHFLPERIWALLKRGDGSDALFSWCALLGLRKPSEPTSQALAVVSLLASDGMEKAMQYTPDCRTQMIKTTKAWFQSSLAGKGDPPEWIWTLPSSAEDLKRLHPATFAQTCAIECPIRFPLDMLQYETLKRVSPQREMKGSKAESANQGRPPSEYNAAKMLVSAMRDVFGKQVEPELPGFRWNKPQQHPQPQQQPQQLQPPRFQQHEGHHQHCGFPRPPKPLLPLPPPPIPTTAKSSHAGSAGQGVIVLSDDDDDYDDDGDLPPAVSDTVSKVLGAVQMKKAKAKQEAKERAEKRKLDKAGGLEKSKGKGVDKSMAKDKSKDKDADNWVASQKRPFYCHEGSRTQYLARSGLKGAGQSQAFKYDIKKKATQAAAEQQAKAWCRKKCKEFKIDVPEHLK